MSPMQLAHDWLAELNRADLSNSDDFFSTDFVYHGRERDFSQPECAEFLREWFAAGASFELHQVVASKDELAIRWSVDVGGKTHWGVGLGTVRNGRVTEFWQQITD